VNIPGPRRIILEIEYAARAVHTAAGQNASSRFRAMQNNAGIAHAKSNFKQRESRQPENPED